MKIAFFDAKSYDRKFFERANEDHGFHLKFFEARLDEDTSHMAVGFDAVCLFVNDKCDARVLATLEELGVRHILMRCAGFDRVDLEAAQDLGLSVQRVPAYSPHAVAEFAVTLLMALNRKVHIAYNRIRDGNFTLAGLEGMDIHGKTVGVIGTGKIGQCFIDIMIGFGCKILAYDVFTNEEYAKKPEVTYTSLEHVYKESDIISLHVPLLDSTKHLINCTTLAQMKRKAVLINTSRGGLVNTDHLVQALKNRTIGGAALDVYEEEEGYFFEDKSADVILDDTLARLQNLKNCIITSHQAFFTNEALEAIASTTLSNAQACADCRSLLSPPGDGGILPLPNDVLPPAKGPTLNYMKSRKMVAGVERRSLLERRQSQRGSFGRRCSSRTDRS